MIKISVENLENQIKLAFKEILTYYTTETVNKFIKWIYLLSTYLITYLLMLDTWLDKKIYE